MRHRVYYLRSAFDASGCCGPGLSPYRQVDQTCQSEWRVCHQPGGRRGGRLRTASAVTTKVPRATGSEQADDPG